MFLMQLRHWSVVQKIGASVFAMFLVNLIIAFILMQITGIDLANLSNPDTLKETTALAESTIKNGEVDYVTQLKEVKNIILDAEFSKLNSQFYLLITVNLFSNLLLALLLIHLFLGKGLRSINLGNKTPILFISSFLLAYHIPNLGSDAMQLNEILGLDKLQAFLFDSDLMSDTIKSLNEMVIIFPNEGRGYFLTFVGICLIPAIGEELLFRGLMQKLLAATGNSIHNAIGIQALVFALVHFNITNFLYYFALGVVLGYMYYWGKNILFPIIVHLINNSLVLINYYAINNVYEQVQNTNPEDLDLNPNGLFSYITIGLSLAIFYMNFKKNQQPVA